MKTPRKPNDNPPVSSGEVRPELGQSRLRTSEHLTDRSTEAAKIAEAILLPEVGATATIAAYAATDGRADLLVLLEELHEKCSKAKAGDLGQAETILLTQAYTLDAIFNNLAKMAKANISESIGAAEALLRMALKAQSQCRASLETLGELKYPKSATFIRQANIANQQQVNNGQIGSQASQPAHEKDANQTNELLEDQHGEWLECGTEGTAGELDQNVATVGKVNRSKDGDR